MRPTTTRSRGNSPCYDPSQRNPRGIGMCADDPSLRKGDVVEGADGRMWQVATRRKRGKKHGVDKYWKPEGPFEQPRSFVSDHNDSACWSDEFNGWFLCNPQGDWIFRNRDGIYPAREEYEWSRCHIPYIDCPIHLDAYRNGKRVVHKDRAVESEEDDGAKSDNTSDETRVEPNRATDGSSVPVKNAAMANTAASASTVPTQENGQVQNGQAQQQASSGQVPSGQNVNSSNESFGNVYKLPSMVNVRGEQQAQPSNSSGSTAGGAYGARSGRSRYYY
jgi:hypothetical protein